MFRNEKELTLVVKWSEEGEAAETVHCLQPNPDAALAVQLVPPGSKLHAIMLCAGLWCGAFVDVCLSVEGFGLDLAGL